MSSSLRGGRGFNRGGAYTAEDNVINSVSLYFGDFVKSF